MSIITVEGSIQVRDDNNNIQSIQGDDFDLDHVFTDSDRPMGPACMYEGTFKEGDLEITLSVSEYPEGAFESHDITVNGGTLVKDDLSVSIQSE